MFGGTPAVSFARDQFVHRQPQTPAVARGVEMGPRPGEIHGERLLCVDCLEFKAYTEFYKSQQKWTLPARECMVCRDAFWGKQRMGPLPSLQPPAPEVTPLQPPARKGTDENMFCGARAPQKIKIDCV